MIKLINAFFFYLKVVLLLITFGFTMYIMFSMNQALNSSFISFAMIILPFTLVLLTFVLSFFFTNGKNHLFFNITCTIAIISLLVIAIRTVADANIILWSKWQMNFTYFENNIEIVKVVLYLMLLVNILLFLKKEKINDNS